MLKGCLKYCFQTVFVYKTILALVMFGNRLHTCMLNLYRVLMIVNANFPATDRGQLDWKNDFDYFYKYFYNNAGDTNSAAVPNKNLGTKKVV